MGPSRSGYRRHGKLIARGAFAGFCLIAGTALAEWTPDAQRCAGNEGSPDERIAACSRAIVSGKLSAEDLATTHYNRALEWRAKREDDKALADYGEAIRINPRYALAYNNRGNIYRANGEYDRAIADFDAALRINPKYAFAHNNLGMALFGKGELDRALASFDRAIRLDPKYAYAYNNRGNAWGGKGEYDRGIADFSEAIRLDPKYGNAYSNRGIAWRKKHQYERGSPTLPRRSAPSAATRSLIGTAATPTSSSGASRPRPAISRKAPVWSRPICTRRSGGSLPVRARRRTPPPRSASCRRCGAHGR